MRLMNMKNATFKTQLFLALAVAVTLSFAQSAFAAAPGITSTAGSAGTFTLTAQDAYLNQPDGNAIYSWGYGCVSGSSPTFDPEPTYFAFTPTCGTMQVPGPTMIVTEGQLVTITLNNNLPTAAGNTSILFPGFNVATNCGPSTAANPPQQGLLACEAVPGGSVQYTFTATAPGTHAYYSGTQGDLQIEMGLYGAIIVLPAGGGPASCNTTKTNLYGKTTYLSSIGLTEEHDFRLAHAAYDHPKSCYDREYLFQWAEMDTRIHKQAEAQVQAKVGCSAGIMGCSLDVQTEPYHPAYFLINGRSMPDLMDPNYASEYPHQPYNGNPHMHPGELTMIRTIGQGRWQHPFHEHANHVRILARDGNLILSPTNPASSLAGTLMFNTDTTPGEAFDGIFYFSGRGLNWDAYGHHPAGTGNYTSQSAIASIKESGSTVTVTFGGNEIPPVGSSVVIAGVTPAGYNGTFTILTSAATSTNTITFTDPNTISPLVLTITGISESPGNARTVTVTTSGTVPSALVGAQVSIAGVTPTAYNGTFTVTSVAGSKFTYNDPSRNLAKGTFTSASATLVGGTTAGATATMDLGANSPPNDPQASLSCTPDNNGYNTGDSKALNYYEWCQDHNKPVQVAPFGDVASGGPATLPDPNVLTNGQWYGGSPYLGPDASLRGSMASCDTTTNATCTTLLPSNTQANPASERGWAFMWHSHNEREITTNNVFPGGMLMMMLVDSREFPIDESQ
jgi:FtsP/CotA-like multicopper oxidase with cupredoxin domain